MYVICSSVLNYMYVDVINDKTTMYTKFFYVDSHLPLYLVAAFAKRIARLALTAPPNGM